MVDWKYAGDAGNGSRAGSAVPRRVASVTGADLWLGLSNGTAIYDARNMGTHEVGH